MVQAHTQQMRQRTRTPPPTPPPIAAAYVTTAEPINKSGCEQYIRIQYKSINSRLKKVKSSLYTNTTSYLGVLLYELSHNTSQCSSVSFNRMNWSRYNCELQLQFEIIAIIYTLILQWMQKFAAFI